MQAVSLGEGFKKDFLDGGFPLTRGDDRASVHVCTLMARWLQLC